MAMREKPTPNTLVRMCGRAACRPGGDGGGWIGQNVSMPRAKTHKIALKTKGLSDEDAARLHYIVARAASAFTDDYETASNVPVKLGRTYGTANICITHRPSDLVAQADDGRPRPRSPPASSPTAPPR
jgi:hypothetical protein